MKKSIYTTDEIFTLNCKLTVKDEYLTLKGLEAALNRSLINVLVTPGDEKSWSKSYMIQLECKEMAACKCKLMHNPVMSLNI